MNTYQRRKARLIASTLMLAAIQSDTPIKDLPAMAAAMNHRQWITVSLAAGVPVAQHPARVLTISILIQVSA